MPKGPTSSLFFISFLSRNKKRERKCKLANYFATPGLKNLIRNGRAGRQRSERGLRFQINSITPKISGLYYTHAVTHGTFPRRCLGRCQLMRALLAEAAKEQEDDGGCSWEGKKMSILNLDHFHKGGRLSQRILSCLYCLSYPCSL